MERRRFLKLFGGGIGTVAAGKAVDNVLLGYEALGTNLKKQDLAALVDQSFLAGVRPTDVADHRVVLWDDNLRIKRDGDIVATHVYPALSQGEVGEIDDDHGFGGLLSAGLPVVEELRSTTPEYRFYSYPEFFERVREGTAETAALELLRGVLGSDPDVVSRFTGANPAHPEAVVEGLAAGFREHASYDYARYVAGSVQDNVLFGAMNLRKPLRHEVSFEAVMEEGQQGMFCYEFTRRSMEALHAVPAADQRAPVIAGSVGDVRHKHVYTVIASLLREDGDLVVPMTFVDYTHSTLYDDLGLRGVLGDGLDAYNRRHRADSVYWTFAGL